MSFFPCKLVGILNVTPDSFSDGGKYDSVKKALMRARRMVREGADILDIGGESSVAGSQGVSEEEELNRVIPVVSAIREELPNAFLSIDTHKAEVAKQALELGAMMINDITAFRGDPEMFEVVGTYKPFVVIMHSKNDSARTSFEKGNYDDVVMDIKRFLLERVRLAIRYGVPKEKIILDPGLGFFLSSSNDPAPSFEVIRRLREFKELGFPIYISPSKKSFLGGATLDRKIKTLACSSICVYNGADYLRVHDVFEHREVIDTVQAIQNLKF